MIDRAALREWLPKADPSSHKDTFGRVMVVGAWLGFSGAPLMAAAAAARCGAGVVTLALPRTLVLAIAGRVPELVYLPLDESEAGVADASAARQVAAYLGEGRIGAVVLGPGFHSLPATDAFFLGVLARVGSLPTVVDAGGLNILAKTRDWPARLPERAILTPHPGEARRLAGGEVGKDVLAWTRAHARDWRAVVALKGACTVIASPEGETFVHDRPNPALATAGTGDVLAGCIGAFLAAGLTPFRAAALGVAVHGEAGALVASEIGVRGALATDVVARLPRAMAALAAP